MALISFTIEDHTALGLDPNTGHVVFTPTRIHTNTGGGIGTMKPFTVQYTNSFDVELENTTAEWLWKISVNSPTPIIVGYYAITGDTNFRTLLQQEPDNAWWVKLNQLIAMGGGEPGAPGAPGTPGKDGSLVTLTAGEVVKLPPGSAPTVSVTGTPTVKRLNVGVVTGDKGEPGTNGLNGSNVLPTNAAILQGLQTDLDIQNELSATIGEQVAPKLDKTEAASTYATNTSVTTEIAARVDPLVADAIAADPTIATAAGDAVDTYIAAKGVATPTVSGLMSAADKTKLNTATSIETPNAIVMRNSTGRIRDIGDPTSLDHLTRRGYVDNLIQASTVVSGLASSTNLNDVIPTAFPFIINRQQTSDAVAGNAALNYPPGALAGMLRTSLLASDRIIQEYFNRANGAEAGTVFVRGMYGGVWSAWRILGAGGGGAPAFEPDITLDLSPEPILQTAFSRSKGGIIGTSGKAVVSLRFDHWLNYFGGTLLPMFRSLGIPAGVCYYSRMLTPGDVYVDADSTNFTWADVQSWNLSDGIEVWSHSRSHADTPGQEVTAAAQLAALTDEIVGSKTELEAFMPKIKVQGWMMPGNSPRGGNALPYVDFDSTKIDALHKTRAGRLMRRTYPIVETDAIHYLRSMPTGVHHGAGHLTTDAFPLSQLTDAIDQAIARKGGIEFMTHAGTIGQVGKTTLADYTAFLEYIAQKRDEGLLEILTPSGMYVADPSRTDRPSLIFNGDLEGFDPVTKPGPWTSATGMTAGSDPAHGTTAIFPSTKTVMRQGNPYARKIGFSGETFRLEAWLKRETAGTAAVARIGMHDASDTAYWNDVRTMDLPADGSWKLFRWHFTIPIGTTYPRLEIGRESGGGVELGGVEIVKV